MDNLNCFWSDNAAYKCMYKKANLFEREQVLLWVIRNKQHSAGSLAPGTWPEKCTRFLHPRQQCLQNKVKNERNTG